VNTGEQTALDIEQACERADHLLRLGVFSHLMATFTRSYGQEQAHLLGAAVLNEILSEEPGNLEGQRYSSENRDLIMREARKLHADKIAFEACSYLFAIQIFYWNFQLGRAAAVGKLQNYENRAAKLADRASNLHLFIPSTYHLSGSDDALASLGAICRFAQNFAQQQGLLKAEVS
jgi:hypothetical protein